MFRLGLSLLCSSSFSPVLLVHTFSTLPHNSHPCSPHSLSQFPACDVFANLVHDPDTGSGTRFKHRPGQKFENENFCFRRTPAVVKACHPCRARPIKTPLYKT